MRRVMKLKQEIVEKDQRDEERVVLGYKERWMKILEK